MQEGSRLAPPASTSSIESKRKENIKMFQVALDKQRRNEDFLIFFVRFITYLILLLLYVTRYNSKIFTYIYI